MRNILTQTEEGTPAQAADGSAITGAVDPEVYDFNQTLAYGTDAINFLLVGFRCEARFRPYIDCLVGLSGGRVIFSASNLEVARRARPDKERSPDTNKSWVKVTRNDFEAWQAEKGINLVECERGRRERYYDADGNEKFHGISSIYTLHIIKMAERVVAEAQKETERWERAPLVAIEWAAYRVAGEFLEGTAAPSVQPRHEPGEVAKLKRQLKSAATHMRKAKELLQQTEERGWLVASSFAERTQLEAEYEAIEKELSAPVAAVRAA